jgi:hypothetical protein
MTSRFKWLLLLLGPCAGGVAWELLRDDPRATWRPATVLATITAGQLLAIGVAALRSSRGRSGAHLALLAAVAAGCVVQFVGHVQTAIAEHNDVGALSGGRHLALVAAIATALAGVALAAIAARDRRSDPAICVTAGALTAGLALWLPGIGAVIIELSYVPASLATIGANSSTLSSPMTT